jgi:hypothetical protein
MKVETDGAELDPQPAFYNPLLSHYQAILPPSSLSLPKGCTPEISQRRAIISRLLSPDVGLSGNVKEMGQGQR